MPWQWNLWHKVPDSSWLKYVIKWWESRLTFFVFSSDLAVNIGSIRPDIPIKHF